MTSTRNIFDDKPNSTRQQELCTEHSGKYLDLYCKSCKCIICRLCYTESHAKHNVTDFKNLIQNQLNQNVFKIQENIFKCGLQLELLKDQESKCLSDVEKISTEIDIKCTILINIIKEYQDELLKNIDIFKKEEFERIAYLSNKVEARINVLKSLVKSSEELANKIYKEDLIKEFDVLKRRADMIIDENLEDLIVDKVCPNYMFCDMYQSADIYIKHILGYVIKNESKDLFSKNIGCDSKFEMKITKYLIRDNKKITIKTEKMDVLKTKIKPISKHKFRRVPIGMTISGSSMYLIFEESSKVLIYDKNTMTKKESIDIPKLKEPYKIVFVNKHLLILDGFNKTLHCVNLKNLKFTRWKCRIQFVVNLLPLSNDNVLISGTYTNTMKEFQLTGEHVRDITLTEEIKHINDVCVFDEERLLISYMMKHDDNLSTINLNGDILLTFKIHSEIYYDIEDYTVLTFKVDQVTYCLIHSWAEGKFYAVDKNLNYMKEIVVDKDEQASIESLRISMYESIFVDNERNIFLFRSHYLYKTMVKCQILE